MTESSVMRPPKTGKPLWHMRYPFGLMENIQVCRKQGQPRAEMLDSAPSKALSAPKYHPRLLFPAQALAGRPDRFVTEPCHS